MYNLPLAKYICIYRERVRERGEGCPALTLTVKYTANHQARFDRSYIYVGVAGNSGVMGLAAGRAGLATGNLDREAISYGRHTVWAWQRPSPQAKPLLTKTSGVHT